MINEGSGHLEVRRTGVDLTLVTLEKNGAVVGQLHATLHFEGLDPKYHVAALQCVSRSRLVLPPDETSARIVATPVRARPWWKFWLKAPHISRTKDDE